MQNTNMKEPYRRRKMRFRNDSANYVESIEKGEKDKYPFPLFLQQTRGNNLRAFSKLEELDGMLLTRLHFHLEEGTKDS